MEDVHISSVVLGDVNNNNYSDLIIAGTNGTTISLVYYNNNSFFILNDSEHIQELWYGSIALIDYDNDGDLDILMIGEDYWNMPTAKLYRND